MLGAGAEVCEPEGVGELSPAPERRAGPGGDLGDRRGRLCAKKGTKGKEK